MSNLLRRNGAILKVLCKASPATTKALIQSASPDLVKALCECALNVLKGRVTVSSLQKKKLTRHKRDLRDLVKKKTSFKRRRQILQKGGFLGLLLKPVVSLLGGLLSAGS